MIHEITRTNTKFILFRVVSCDSWIVAGLFPTDRLLRRVRRLRLLLAKLKTPSNDCFEDQVVSAPGHADADTEIELPFGRYVQIDRGEDLMSLLARRIETAERAETAVVLQSGIHFFRYRVRDLEIRGKFKAAFLPRAAQCFLESWIEREIPLAHFLVDDWTNFPTPLIFGKLPAYPTNLLRQTHADRPFPFRGNAEARPNVRTGIIPPAAVAGAGENVEPRFEPFVEAVGDLDRFMPRVVRRQGAVVGRLCSFGGEVIVQFDHGDIAGDSFGSVDLNLVIVLSRDDREPEANKNRRQGKQNSFSRQDVRPHQLRFYL